ncbi:MAG: 50S ribosomal protein L30 [Euryarchaeota archaeon]|jgi:large subunit ribosomal protein L30|nr:50S ribosomal protein L30 [Euryarchaeota archaeon]MBT4391086.1 50S ribosomal protein L30 [Euryarchaeota archaeon]MBT4803084.1 50S ribosomal protein L30 [Euryarchaeota archaeon]MBT5613537.1 50S ribosomal protein L30 [Euryarchaeota archaeon]MBT6683346.1 50S ribosomal protein L30 [Euryarchaeota archaeon]
MAFLVIRARSDRGVTVKIRDTMGMLNLTKVNHATIVPNAPTYEGMLNKSKDYITWGEIDSDMISNLLKERGRMVGDKPVNDSVINDNSKFSSIDEFANAIVSGDATLKDVDGLKPVLRLHPPRGSKGWGGIKRSYTVGGALGFRGEAIRDLVSRMM